MTTQDHVSTLDLDAYFASGQPANTSVSDHVGACVRCRAYVASLEHMAEEGLALRPRPPRSRPRWLAPALSAAAIAVAAGMILFVRGRPDSLDYVGTKGTPAVQLLVHRGGDTWVWDGRTPVAPGDAVAVQVACEGLDRVTVVAKGPAGLERVKEVDCPVGKGALPFTLVVDDAPGAESFAVVLSRGPISDSELRGAVAENRRAGGVWVDAFLLPKAVGADR